MRNKKVALITGSSRGIGQGIALELAKSGYDIALHFRSSSASAKEIAEVIKKMGVKTCLLQGDTGDELVPERLVNETINKLGRLDVLVNNAGISLFEELEDISVSTMDKLYAVNYRGMILGAKAAAKYMKEHKIKGNIVFNTSVRAFTPHCSDAIYGGVKAGLNRTIRSLAIDLGRYGIRVNGFSPGVINVTCPDEDDEKSNPFYRNTHRFIPLRRNGYASDIGDVVSWLVSEKSSYVTGQIIGVDGGLSIVGAPECMGDLYDVFDVREIADETLTFSELMKHCDEHEKLIMSRKEGNSKL